MRAVKITVSGILVAVSCIFLYLTGEIRDPKGGALLGPRFFPYIVLSIIIILNLIYIINTLIENEKIKWVVEKPAVIRFFFTLTLYFLYINVIESIGFIISTIIFMFILSVFFYGKFDKKLITAGAASIVLPILLYLLFNQVFHVLLP